VLENILPGTYYIKEIQAPAGYILYDNYIQIRPEFNEDNKKLKRRKARNTNFGKWFKNKK